jgi:predicted lipoprotein with Yx(FWY)xxD motif
MTQNRLLRLAGTLPVILVLAAACSSAAATPSPTTAAAPSAAAPSTEAASPSSAASPSEAASPGGSATAETYQVKVAQATINGATASFLTGEDGKTLYIFKKDTANSGKSACGAGTCSDNWPAFTVDQASQLQAGSGVSGKLDVITRDDGTKQVTYNGQPLYYFAGDTAAGATNGAAIPNWAVANP